MVLPDKFKCVVTNWDYIYGLCREVADDIKASGYRPDVIVALARGGWFPGRVLCDFLGLNDLTSLKIEHYTGTASPTSGPEIRYPLSQDSISGKNVLIVDDIVDTGKSISHAKKYVQDQGPREVKTAVLQYLYTSEIKPDYCGEVLEEWAWVIFPWNFLEDMIDIISKLMVKEKRETWSVEDLKSGLYRYHSLDPVSLEIAQPGRLREVMDEMERRGMVRSGEMNGERFWRQT